MVNAGGGGGDFGDTSYRQLRLMISTPSRQWDNTTVLRQVMTAQRTFHM